MTIKLYHSTNMRSLRVLWLLEELELDYDLENIPREKVYTYAQTPEYLAINPLAKFPSITDGDVTMVESVAIMEYILNKYGDGGLVPARDSDAYALYLQWLHFGEAGMGPFINTLLGHTMLLPENKRVPAIAHWAKGEMDKCLAFMSHGLGDKPYLCGDSFTAADISVTYMLLLMKLLKKFDDAPENVKAYWERISARDAWIKTSKM